MTKRVLLSFPPLAALCALCVIYIDHPLILWFEQHRAPILPIFTELSRLGHGTFWFVLAGVILLLGLGAKYAKLPFKINAKRFVEVGGFALAALVITGLITRLAKWGIGRWRPRYLFENGVYDFTPFALEAYKTASLPSGHSQVIASVCTIIALLRPKLAPLLIPLALLVATSRIVLLQHFLADIIAGLWLGVVGPLLLWHYWHCKRAAQKL